MGEELSCISYETAEQLAVQQREYFVKVIKRKKYVLNSGESAQASDSGIRVAPSAKVILPRDGVEIGYSTLCDWPIQLYESLKPLERLFYRDMGQSHLWHLDETTLQVLGEPGRANQTNSYLIAHDTQLLSQFLA